METILTAAIRRSTLIITAERPWRHDDIFHRAYQEGFKLYKDGDEKGFLTSEGRFVGRSEAREIAFQAGQVVTHTEYTQLYTEDLW